MNRLPLAGRRVLITRAAQQAGKLSEGFRALGAEPIEVPVLEIRLPQSFEALDEALRSVDQYDWLVFTSANTVRVVQVRAVELGISLSHLKARIAAVGRATTQALERLAHLNASLTPEEYVAESLVAQLAPQVAGCRVLLARAEVARDVIPVALRAAGAKVDVVDAYRNVMPQNAPVLLREALKKGIDAASFTSSSSVTHLAEAAKAAGIAFPFAGVAAVSIGPITSRTLHEFGWEPAAEANPHDVPGLISALAAALRANS